MPRGPLTAGLLVIYFILLLFGFQLVLMFLAAIASAITAAEVHSFWVIQVLTLVASTMTVLFVLAPRFGARPEFREQLRRGDRGIWSMAAVWFVGVTLARLAWIAAMAMIYDHLGTPGLPTPGMPETAVETAAFVIVLIIIAPVFEELLVRGAILTLFRQWGARWALVASSVIFTFMHEGSLFRFAPDIALSLLLALIVLRHGNLLVAMALHAANNLSALGMSGLHTLPWCPVCGLGAWFPVVLAAAAIVWVVLFRSRFAVLVQHLGDLWRRDDGVPWRTGLGQLFRHNAYKTLLVVLLIKIVAETTLALGVWTLPG